MLLSSPRSSSLAIIAGGSSVMMLSTPRSTSDDIFSGSLTVQTWTSLPAAWARSNRAAVATSVLTLRKSTSSRVMSPIERATMKPTFKPSSSFLASISPL